MKVLMGKDVPVKMAINPVAMDCRITVGGQDLSRYCRALCVDATVGELTSVRAELMPLGGLDVEGLCGELKLTVVDMVPLLRESNGELVELVALESTDPLYSTYERKK